MKEGAWANIPPQIFGHRPVQPQPTAVTSAKPMPAAKFGDLVGSGTLMIALPARHRRQ